MQLQTSPGELKIGDRIRIVQLRGLGISSYYLHPDTKRVIRKLIARRRSVRVARIDEHGPPWYLCRFRLKNGGWERHQLALCDHDLNWVKVKCRLGKK